MYKNYKDQLFNDKIILKRQPVLRSYHHNVYTIEINKISLSSNHGKRSQTFDRITTYPYKTHEINVCESEMLRVLVAKVKLKMLSEKCESETYAKEKDKSEMFLKYVKTKCESKM